MQTINDYNFSGKKAIVRVDYNVPKDDNNIITDTTRIEASIPTIKKILGDGGSTILMSHMGRPKKGPEEKFSLKHVAESLSNLINQPVKFASDCVGEKAIKASKNVEPGEILLLENLRFHEEEKKGDKAFAKELASLADVYVNDAFATAHRAHASTAIIAEFFPNKKFAGSLLQKEIKNISKVLTKDVKRPYTAIIGGAKISGKIEVIKQLIDIVDNILIGGGMMFTFIKAMGYDIGKSILEKEHIGLAKELMKIAEEKGVNLYLPSDTTIADKFENDANIKESDIKSIDDGWIGMDIGARTTEQFIDIIKESKTILWNGPMGVFEMSNFEKGTKSIAFAVAEATTSNNAFSLIGGGDSVSAVNKFHLVDRISYISTGGGALLEYIEGKKLPGIAALET